MKTRVTIRDIAKKLKIHHSTVSRALKNDSRISKVKRDQIHKIAQELGYYPDPMLSALMAYRSQNAPKNFRGLLGLVTNYETREGWHTHEKVGYFAGATRQAKLLGYELETFWLHEPGLTKRRLSQILSTRNVQGLLFIPQPRSHAHIRLKWENYASVVFGHTLRRPQLRKIDTDRYESMMILMRRLRHLGYLRPGLACETRNIESTNRQWASAFWAYAPLPQDNQIPVYLIGKREDFASFKSWFVKYRPDVLVSDMPEPLEWLKKMGLRIPQDVGFATPARHGVPSFCSGIDENSELIGEVAVNALAGMLRRGERGIPAFPISTLVPGIWVDGTTLRSAAGIKKGRRTP